ncbi:MAG: hypothetical protein JO202_01610 [Ktedonobacteraceae bacterium]|nr:hypothetical protein [Ktedonobacteraceae bacterium]
MGREVKRVPLDFDWPLDTIWSGYLPDHCLTDEEADSGTWQQHPPIGPGYQLWENTTEGSPQSPVFDSAGKLATWCEEHTTTWGYRRTSQEEWLRLIESACIYGQFGNVIGL